MSTYVERTTIVKFSSGDEFFLNAPWHSIQRLEERFVEQTGEVIDFVSRLQYLLTIPEIEDFILNEVKIGESFAIFDYNFNISMAIAIHIEDIDVKTVFRESHGKSLKLFEEQKIIEIHGDTIDFKKFIKRKKIKINN